MSKTCPICKDMLPLTSFGKDKHSRDGFSWRCKPCNRQYEAARRLANPEAHRAKVARWVAKNPAKIADYAKRNSRRHAETTKEWEAANPDRVREKSRRYREKHKEKCIAANKLWREENTDLIRETKRRWNEKNPDRVAAHGARRRSDPKYKIEATIRARLQTVFRNGGKSGRTFGLLGYSSQELKVHLERQFDRRMSWVNYGAWHIDHVLPLALFKYETPEDPEFRAAWALPNLRPLWKIENIKKGAKRLTLL